MLRHPCRTHTHRKQMGKHSRSGRHTHTQTDRQPATLRRRRLISRTPRLPYRCRHMPSARRLVSASHFTDSRSENGGKDTVSFQCIALGCHPSLCLLLHVAVCANMWPDVTVLRISSQGKKTKKKNKKKSTSVNERSVGALGIHGVNGTVWARHSIGEPLELQHLQGNGQLPIENT